MPWEIGSELCIARLLATRDPPGAGGGRRVPGRIEEARRPVAEAPAELARGERPGQNDGDQGRRLQARNPVAAGEQKHSGQVRLVVEAALPLSLVLRGAKPRARALDVFSRLRIWDTEDNIGVLVYVLLADKAVEAAQPDADRRIGVIWHTTGSGKSLCMVFLVGILRRRLSNPTFVIEVDRTDLDKQLHDQFVAALL